jgi:hypothetical protein
VEGRPMPGWPHTFDAEHVALTQLHAESPATLDRVPPDSGGRPKAGLEQPLVTQHRNRRRITAPSRRSGRRSPVRWVTVLKAPNCHSACVAVVAALDETALVEVTSATLPDRGCCQ